MINNQNGESVFIPNHSNELPALLNVAESVEALDLPGALDPQTVFLTQEVVHQHSKCCGKVLVVILIQPFLLQKLHSDVVFDLDFGYEIEEVCCSYIKLVF